MTGSGVQPSARDRQGAERLLRRLGRVVPVRRDELLGALIARAAADATVSSSSAGCRRPEELVVLSAIK